ncbi:hypothetical protein LTR20_001105 [Exophiala xenobiotica]|nr:hypothetical protein LTS13_005382 [Exophiala xenobiotica]KAK5396964.1 hypothetical protein LTR79_005600 [Exophiala xenobiotica]KAK5410627.1 hypothetical protein LTR90_008210 [Exophiala xenobiotica]KAK5470844.1 hypothetical protein LTR20_001105 [Exophiala xenobiotica]KAK5478476.1 hypothetical protein LTR26_007986 [Exophiala xenobiotica]
MSSGAYSRNKAINNHLDQGQLNFTRNKSLSKSTDYYSGHQHLPPSDHNLGLHQPQPTPRQPIHSSDVTVTPKQGQDAATPGSTSRSNSNSSDEDSRRAQDGLRIPGARFDEPPPPLPPPRYNEELAQGIDVAWSWGNSDPFNSARRLAPIKLGSSLYGGYMDTSRNSDRSRDTDDMDLDDDDFARRGSTVSTIRSPSQADIRVGAHIPVIRKQSSPTLANQRLQGEMPLAQQNFNLSSQAYDQRLLSKIGKPNSPPRQSRRSGSAESTSYSTKLSLQIKDPRAQSLSTNELSAASLDPISRWITSPASTGVSPASRPGWRDYNIGQRSPSTDSAAASLVLDPELFVQHRPSGLLSIGSSIASPDDLASLASRSQRGSYEHGIFPEPESDIAGDDGAGFRNLNLGDSQHHGERRSSKQGMKRRARSPPSDLVRGDKSPSRGNSSAELFQKFHATASARSPVSKYQAKHGSVSSTASSARHNSYASSLSVSVAGSSMTSISSFDKQSPLDPPHPAYITSAHPVASPATSIASSRIPPKVALDTKLVTTKISIQSPVGDTNLPPVNRVGNSFICDCCPKKPRKFDTELELR